MSAVAKLMRRKLIGDLMGLLRTTASITSAFPTKLINMSIEKKMAKPVYILFLDVYLKCDKQTNVNHEATYKLCKMFADTSWWKEYFDNI